MSKKKSADKTATVGQVLGLYFGYARRRFWGMFFAISLTGAAVVFEALAPEALKRLVDVLGGDHTLATAQPLLVKALLLLFFVKLGSWLFWRLGGWININFQPRTMAELQSDAFTYLMGHSYQYFADNFAGSLVKKVGRFVRGSACDLAWILFPSGKPN